MDEVKEHCTEQNSCLTNSLCDHLTAIEVPLLFPFPVKWVMAVMLCLVGQDGTSSGFQLRDHLMKNKNSMNRDKVKDPSS